jgi:hypothetical protein
MSCSVSRATSTLAAAKPAAAPTDTVQLSGTAQSTNP